MSDGADNSHKLTDIGDVRDEGYEEDVMVAKPARKMGKISDDLSDPQWNKPKWELAQLQIKVVAEEKKADAELFQIQIQIQILADAIAMTGKSKNNVASCVRKV